MADTARVRLVRCPNCENLLPELADYSVYQCGGCGTVLRAKNKHQEGETLSQKSDEERAEAASVKSGNSVEKDVVDFSDASDTEAKSKTVSQGLDPTCLERNDAKGTERLENQPIVEADKLVDDNNYNVDKSMDDLNNSMGRENGAAKSQIDSSNSASLSTEGGYGRKVDWQTRERAGVEGRKGVRFSTSKYSKEGPSNGSDSVSGFEDQRRNQGDEDGAHKVKFLEQDRAELLRKLDELKDQFGRSSDAVDRTKAKASMEDIINPSNPYIYDNWDGTSGSNRVPRKFSVPNKHFPGPPLSSFHGHNMSGRGRYSSMHNPSNISGFDDPYRAEMIGRGLYQFPNSYRRQFSDAQFQHNPILHQPSCSCYLCLEKYHQVSAPAPLAYYNRRFPDVSFDNLPYHPENEAPYGPYDYNSRISAPPMNFHDQQSRSRWSRGLRSEIGGFSGNRPRSMLFGGGRQRCHPISCGAPFLTCYNCFELLLLPKKVQQMGKNDLKILCGACSSVISFRFVHNKLVLSEQGETKQIPLDVDISSRNVGRGSAAQFLGPLKHYSDNFSSNDYDKSGYDFQSVDPQLDPGLGSAKQHVMQSFHSSSPSISDDEENSPEVLIAPMEVVKIFDESMKTTLSPPPPGSPLQSYFDYSSNDHFGNKFANGNQSSRSDQEMIKPDKVTSRQNSLKDASPVTEMKVPLNEYSQTVISQDYGDAYKRRDQARNNNGGESFFGNIIKKSFKSNRPDRKGSVIVNGHIIPDRLLKKAEKLAGPIHSGKYWYDSRAGFWGVMGGPCLGIIPPFIEELNYPMPEDCADGKTGVFVNGRELHQKDLDLLASRGLPTARDRSYIIEISGRLVDEDTGEEMDCLGKLAPTIEKVKHGFGMKVPRAAKQPGKTELSG